MTRPDSRSAPVDVVGGLELKSPDGVDFQIRGRGPAVELEIRRLRDLLVIRKLVSGSGIRSRLLTVQKLGRHGDVTLRVMVGSVEVAKLSPHSRGNWVSAILRIAPVEVRLGGLVRSLMA